ncbi:MAG: aldo/keto reductase [Roseibium sp.]
MIAPLDVKLWNGKTVPRIGIGTWVMGGEQYWGDMPTGWQGVDDAESLATLRTAFDLGVRIIDTADQYGAGHSERIIAKALNDMPYDRSEFVIATKFGLVCDPDSGNITGISDNPATVAPAVEASMKRMGLEHIDLVQFHLNNHPVDKSRGVFEELAKLYESGKIGGFGWSTDDVIGAVAFVDLPGYVAVQHDLNLFAPGPDMLKAAEKNGLWAFNRQPLAMGLLTGKHTSTSAGFGKNDIRGSGAEWLAYFEKDGRPSAKLLAKLDKLRDLLTSDGRSLAQGALGWVLAQSPRTIPLPGCRTPQQACDNFGVIKCNALSSEVIDEIAKVLKH